MEHEHMNNTDVDPKGFMELEQFAQGKIEARVDQQERLDEFTERVGGGEFHTKISWRQKFKMLIARCVDGRNTGKEKPLAPNAAGGTETLFVADDLTTKRYATEDGTTVGGYENIVSDLVKRGHAVGGHEDGHASEEASGCGANDRLPAIYQYIAENEGKLKGLAETILGEEIDGDIHSLIVGAAAQRSEFSNGALLLKKLKAQIMQNSRDDAFTDNLVGPHNEVLAIINKRRDTTLDRDAVEAEFGPNYQAFNVDAWAFQEAAQVISPGGNEHNAEVKAKIVAMTYYNLATTMVLAGPKMRVVVLD